MKLTTFMLLKQNISYWLMLVNAGLCSIKAKYEINKIYVIKAKYKLLVITNS